MFYVYSLIDPRNNKPFYIGKGSGDRVLTHQKFKSSCNNHHKDAVIKKILTEFNSIPYKILKEFDNELDAYLFEEKVIAQIGLKNLTNICDSNRPPTQKGKIRTAKTVNKIKENSKKQGKERTVEYVKNNSKLIFDILTAINAGERRGITINKLDITIDLFNKVKRKYLMYVDILNSTTPYCIKQVNIVKLNGMKHKVFFDNKKLLINMYSLINAGIKRKDIVNQLNISVDFYDRFKNQQEEFTLYLTSVEVK